MKTPFLISLLLLSSLTSLALADDAAPSTPLPVAAGPYKPTMDSLKQYKCPDWFRDAKFGIWAHWGPQAVPMDGDWYARGMYEQGSKHYKYHLAHYGHPSKFGYKDIIPLWKAEKWDPDRLMQLYKKAGAKYFVSMGTHHDDFFLWNSKLHKWNAANMGPKRDVVGDWQKAATKYGLKFGVSEHLGASFTWFQASHRADKTGPLAGVPYDGANPEFQDLYHFPAKPGDTGWYSNDPRWQHEWYAEIKELVDNYHPDLLYSDGGVPFGNEVGLSMIAHLYNTSAAAHGGTAEVIYNCKQKSEGRWVEDVERGIMPRIDPNPWQTDTSIGDWFYDRNYKFKPVVWVIHMLVDNVSKNGNLLLNVVQRPDGSLDAEVEDMLAKLAEWNAIHGEAIYGSRPWLVYGESAVKVKGGSFGENYKYNAREIRFTTKGPVLYAIALGWPEDSKITVRSLAKPAGENINNITSVSLLGYDGKLDWKQTADGLIVTLPEKKVSEYTAALKIIASDLKPVAFTALTPVVRPDKRGVLTLDADSADLHGGLKVEERQGKANIGFWDDGHDWASWKVEFSKPGMYHVTARCALADGDSKIAVEVAGATLAGKATRTGDWDKYASVDCGTVVITKTGTEEIKVRPANADDWKPVNLREVKIERDQWHPLRKAYFGTPGVFAFADYLRSNLMRKELGLSASQMKQIAALIKMQVRSGSPVSITREEMDRQEQKRAEEFSKKLETILRPDQINRELEILTQLDGSMILADVEHNSNLATLFELNGEQKKSIKSIGDNAAQAADKAVQTAVEDMSLGNIDQRVKAGYLRQFPIEKAAEEKIRKTLTPKQLDLLKDLKGKEIDVAKLQKEMDDAFGQPWP